MRDDQADLVIRIVVVVTLGVVLLASIIGITVTAVTTDRNMLQAELLTFGGVILLAGMGGVSWWTMPRRRWRVNVERNGAPPPDSGDLDLRD